MPLSHLAVTCKSAEFAVLLFLGGGACPSCGSQVAMDITVDDIVMDDETIPGLEEIADAIGDAAMMLTNPMSYLSVWVQKPR